MSEALQQFVSIPVPSQFAPQIYAYLAELTGAAGPQRAQDDRQDGPMSERWTVEDFRRLIADQRDSVQVTVAVLDILAEQPRERVSYTHLAEKLGLERSRLQGALSGFSRVLRSGYDGLVWPMTWVETLTGEPGLKKEYFYTVTETVAERWREARSK
ncbi:helix-turn-helix domain-containing protein [Peterkaempfera griseoplana]|uniref:hypothetical protein n=1 Tax=Peterkaempfera griseoplana TaxID=66896 RepID=UPI0006E12C41|nr:hypothetical protein [Peterkaempfera griseoplana]